MNWDRIGRGARAIRLRLGLRQVDLAARAGVDRGAVSRLERGHGRRLSGARLESILDALGARLDGRLAWRGADLDRMLDARHAQLQSGTKRRLEAWSWELRAEVSFNRYGERGRIDLFAWHPASRSVAVIEVKTELVDAQALLGAMDVRTRLAPGIARGLGWPYPAAVVPVIVFAEDRTTRRRLVALAPLFSRYAVRGRAATARMHRPSLPPPPGLLWFSDLSNASLVRVSGQRVRVRRPR